MFLFNDKRSQLQVIGCILKKPDLLDEVALQLTKDDFPETFHKIVFASINNLYIEGVKNLDYIAIDNFLSQYPQQYIVFNDNNGIEYLEKAMELSSLDNFDYNYKRLKKLTILREYSERGMDVSYIYDESVISPKKAEEMQENFDKMSIQDVIDEIDKRFLSIKEKFLATSGNYGSHGGYKLRELKEKLKETPELGVPLTSSIMTTIARGARMKKLYLRSAPTGVGKTRLTLADATNIAVDTIWDTKQKSWVTNGYSEPALFITTELEIDEVQTPMLAFVSAVEEEKILNGDYTPEEEKRIDTAIEIIERSPIYIEHLPNFDIAEVERTVQRHVLNNKVRYVFFD